MTIVSSSAFRKLVTTRPALAYTVACKKTSGQYDRKANWPHASRNLVWEDSGMSKTKLLCASLFFRVCLLGQNTHFLFYEPPHFLCVSILFLIKDWRSWISSDLLAYLSALRAEPTTVLFRRAPCSWAKLCSCYLKPVCQGVLQTKLQKTSNVVV